MECRTLLLFSALLAVLAAGSPGSLRACPGGQPSAEEPVGLEVEVLDGRSGGTVAGASVSFTARGGRWPNRGVILEKRGDRFALEDTGFLRGERSTHRLDVALPPGWVREPEEYDPMPPVVTLRTRKLFRSVVVWPEADIRVRVLQADGSPAEGARLVAERRGVRLREQWTSISHSVDEWDFPDIGSGRTGADGWGRVAGVPAIPGARYRIVAYGSGRFAHSPETVFRKGTEKVTLEVRLPAKGTDMIMFGSRTSTRG